MKSSDCDWIRNPVNARRLRDVIETSISFNIREKIKTKRKRFLHTVSKKKFKVQLYKLLKRKYLHQRNA